MSDSSQKPGGSDEDTRSLVSTFIVSTICHIAFFALIVYAPRAQSPSRRYMPSVINVRMVAAPKPKAVSVPAPKKKKRVIREVKKKKAKPVPKNAVSLKKQKKKKAKPAKTETPEELEKKAEEARRASVEEAIARLKTEVDQTTVIDRLKKDVEREGANIPGALSGMGKQVSSIMDVYKAEIAVFIGHNFAFPMQMAAGRTDLISRLAIKIMPDGEIRDIWFEKKSGNSYLDDAAFKALKKSSPLPALPQAYTRPFFEVVVGFTPEGIL